jgi:hypothetical protein
VAVHIFNPSYVIGIDNRIDIRDQLWANTQDPVQKILTKARRLVTWLMWQNICLASVRPWFQTQVLPKNFYGRFHLLKSLSLSLTLTLSPPPHLSFFLVGVGNWFYDAFLILLIHITGILAGLTGETSVDELGQF